MEKTGRYFIIEGKVQGVFYRDSTLKKAKNLGLTGWVRNSSQGHVECSAFGTADTLNQLEDWLWEGPPSAKVNSIKAETIAYEVHNDFERRSTLKG